MKQYYDDTQKLPDELISRQSLKVKKLKHNKPDPTRHHN
jgi:hypothetical protein